MELVVPDNLKFYLHRLADRAQPKNNILRVNALNASTANSGGLIIVRLPMTLCDLRSFAMNFETTLYNGGIRSLIGDTGDIIDQGFRGILPKGIEGLISRMEVSVNGLGLLNIQNYNLLYSLLKESHQTLDTQLGRGLLQNEKDVVPILDTITKPAVDNTLVPIHISNWYVDLNGEENTTATIYCATTSNQPVPPSNSIVYAPVATFFGLGSEDAMSDPPYIDETFPITSAYQTTSEGPGVYITRFRLNYDNNNGWTRVATSVTAPGALYSTAENPCPTGFTIYLTPGIVGEAANDSVGLFPNNNNYHTIHDWLGFFKAEPHWLQTLLLGEVEVRITLANKDVLGITHPAIKFTDSRTQLSGWTYTSLPDFSLENIYFTIRTCSFDNNFVDQMLHHKLANGGELEIPYDNYFNVNQEQHAGASQTRFSVNTQCLEKVISCNRQVNYNQWYNAVSNFPCGMGSKTNTDMGLIYKTPYFSTTASNPSGTNYGISDTGIPPSKFNYWQYQVNGVYVPNYKVSPLNTFFLNQEMYGRQNKGHCSTIMPVYLNTGYQMGISLDFQDDDVPRLLSGVDSRGSVAVAYLDQDNNNEGDRTDVFACFKSVIRVGANQQVQVIV
jgi:hypothetical protein